MVRSLAQYHDLTSYHRDRMGGHFLDRQNQPSVYKTYPNAETIQLPKDINLPEEYLSHLLKEPKPVKSPPALCTDDVSRILLLTYSLTAKARHGSKEFYYRSVASAGALYPTEIYVATKAVSGLDDGLYHFNISSHGLTTLRKGDLTANDPPPSLAFFFSAIFFRSAWKYKDRSYRYHLLDTGHLIENLVLSLKALDLPSFLSYDFDDTKVNHLLGLDETKEVCLAICCVPGSGGLHEKETEELPNLPAAIKTASRTTVKETDYPAIREIHVAGGKVVAQATKEGVCDLGLTPENWNKVSHPERWPEVRNYAGSIFERRSRRNFMKGAIPNTHVTALLECLLTPGSTDPKARCDHERSICTGILIGRGEGFQSGFHMMEMESGSIGLVAPGPFMDKMARVCLDQAWLANGAIHFLFLANLHALDRVWGARGYRYAMMTAGRMGERLYLAATAMGLGCCGIGAFYDMEGAGLLGLNQESRLLYLVAVGPVKSKAKG